MGVFETRKMSKRFFFFTYKIIMCRVICLEDVIEFDSGFFKLNYYNNTNCGTISAELRREGARRDSNNVPEMISHRFFTGIRGICNEYLYYDLQMGRRALDNSVTRTWKRSF